MLPYEISPAKNILLNSLSQNWRKAILDTAPFQQIIDRTFEELKHTMPVCLDDILQFLKIEKYYVSSNSGKGDLPLNKIYFTDTEVKDDSVLFLMSCKMKDIENLRVGICNNDSTVVKVNQNILKMKVKADYIDAIGCEKFTSSELIFSKYIAYYFLSTAGKQQLSTCLQSETSVMKSLKISKLKQLEIPISLNVPYVVEKIEEQIYFNDADHYFNQLDNSKSMFEAFEAILTDVSTNDVIQFKADKRLFTAREFALLFARYIVNSPHYTDLDVSVVLESLVHYSRFVKLHDSEWEDEPIEFYGPHHEIEGDIIIVIKHFEQKWDLPENAKIIFIEER
ncbi:hypothetical protein [Lysinibacillus xylanilyticus]|uniref:Uncharacterized protein n=1 Tax=Lysinibacillus xylanilyticus TaxID=582475 RepID=A0ABT4EIL0_9BACI|nr:hypothetical protein [Lysinibacillus xylanilyticus]MCY9545470.1 hypothetical protein [Lysinibacillus xylanilyticus]